MSKGDVLEFRATRLHFALGYFARRGVQLKSYFYPEVSDITDIDSFGIRWNSDLSSIKSIAMCTTERERKEKGTSNRILLVRGLMDLVQASSSYLVMERMSNRLRAFSTTNNVIPIDVERLTELEKKLGISDFYASNTPALKSELLGFWDRLKEIGRSEIKRHYWFLLSDYWFIDSNLQIKKMLSHFETLIAKLMLNERYEMWMYIESVILFSAALLQFAFEVSCQPISARDDYIRVKMIEGISTIEEQERIRTATYKLAAAKIKEVTGESVRIPDRDLEIPPPDYTENLTELVHRLIEHAKYAKEMPRLMDFLLYETVMFDNEVNQDDIKEKLGLDETGIDFVAKLGKNVIRFMDADADKRDFLASFLGY